MCAHFINTFLVDHAADAFKLSYSALSSEFSVSLRFTAFFLPQISSRNCPAFEDPLADAPHAQSFTKWKIFLSLWRHCGPNSALKVSLTPDMGQATSKIKLDLLSLKIRILHCLKAGGI